MRAVCVLSVVLLVVSVAHAFDFSGEYCLVTGGGSGIGLSVAENFAGYGCGTYFIGRNVTRGMEIEDRINTNRTVIEAGGFAKFYHTDMSDIDSVTALFETMQDIVDVEGHIVSHFANSAGVGGYFGVLDTVPADVFLSEHDAILNNLYGTMYMNRAEIKYIKANHIEGASIVNLSSYNGLRACAGSAMYSMSKHGIIGLTQSVAAENVGNIRVNAVAPGLVDTPLTWNQCKTMRDITAQSYDGVWIYDETDAEYVECFAPFREGIENSLPGDKIISPYDIADTVIFLLSPHAAMVSGTTVSVDNTASAT